MIPLIQEEIVKKKKWMLEDEFITTLAVAQSSPGPMAINTSIFVGFKVLGKLGVLTSVLGSSLPSFIVILFIAIFFREIKDSVIFINIFKGIKPAVVALILVPVINMSKKAKVGRKNFYIPLIIGLIISYGKISPIFFIILGFLGGNLYYSKIKKEWIK